MTDYEFNRAKSLIEEIEKLRNNIQAAQYSQRDNVSEREFTLRCIGVDDGIKSPESLFRKIGKMIIVENRKELKQLEKELKEL